MDFDEYLTGQNLDCLRVGFTNQRNYQEIIGDMHLWNEGTKSVIPALQELSDIETVVGCVILQKCNSVEFYTVSQEQEPIQERVKSIWSQHAKNYRPDVVEEHGEHYSGEQVIDHLFKTACGIKSVVIGDNQVRGQVWDAFQTAKQFGATDVLLDTTFTYTRDVLKKVGSETRFNEGYTSAERLAADKVTEEVPGAHVAILGAGSSGQLIAKSLTESGGHTVHVYTNNPEMAAPELPNVDSVIHYDELTERLPEYRGLVAATSSAGTLVSREAERRLADDCLVIDISSPPVVDISRDIIGLNQISKFANETIRQRRNDLNTVKTIIGRSVEECKDEINRKIMERRIGEQLSGVPEYEIDNSLQEFKSELIWSTESVIRERGYKRVNTPHVGVHPIDTVYSKKDVFEVNWFGKTAYLRSDTMIYELLYILNGITPIYEYSATFHQRKEPQEQTVAEFNRFKISYQPASVAALRSECSMVLTESVRRLLADDPPLRQDVMKANPGRWWDEESLPEIPFETVAEESAVDLRSMTQRERNSHIREYVNRTYDSDAYMITQYPESLSFISDRQHDETTTHRFRLFINGWSVVTGALRETRPDVLHDRAKRLDTEIPDPYLRIVEERDVNPYGGFSIGYERLLTKLLDRSDIRDVVTFPRTYKNLKP